MCIRQNLLCKKVNCRNRVFQRRDDCGKDYTHVHSWLTPAKHDTLYCPGCEADRQTALSNPVPPTVPAPARWSTDEDRVLVYFKECGWSYAEISSSILPSRPAGGMSERWREFLRKQVQSGTWNEVIRLAKTKSQIGKVSKKGRSEEDQLIERQQCRAYQDMFGGDFLPPDEARRSRSPREEPEDREARQRTPLSRERAQEEEPRQVQRGYAQMVRDPIPDPGSYYSIFPREPRHDPPEARGPLIEPARHQTTRFEDPRDTRAPARQPSYVPRPGHQEPARQSGYVARPGYQEPARQSGYVARPSGRDLERPRGREAERESVARPGSREPSRGEGSNRRSRTPSEERRRNNLRDNLWRRYR